jgi:hypothetical protein
LTDHAGKGGRYVYFSKLEEYIMSIKDVECPYCGQWQKICHDDGFGYEEGKAHQMDCCHCEKTFCFETSISFDYESSKADCLNGGDHRYKRTCTVPVKYTKMRCEDCDDERPCTDKEMSDLV